VNQRLVSYLVARRRSIQIASRVVTAVMLLSILAAVGIPHLQGTRSHGVRYLLPNSDIFFSRQLFEMPASYFIENFADDPSAVLESGSGIVEFEVEELHTSTWTSPKRPERSNTYSRFTNRRIIIEDGEVKDIESYRHTNNGDEPPNQSLERTPDRDECEV